MPKTGKEISAASGPKFTILWGLEDISLLNKLFFRLSIRRLSCEDIARQSCVEHLKGVTYLYLLAILSTVSLCVKYEVPSVTYSKNLAVRKLKGD